MAEYRLNQGGGVVVSDANPLPIGSGTLATEATLSDASSSLATLVSDTAAIKTAAQDTTAVNTYPLPTTPVTGGTAAMTTTTRAAVTGVGAPGAGKFNYITAVIISNTHATQGSEWQFCDGDTDNTFGPTFPAPAVGSGLTAGTPTGALQALPTPLKQPSANLPLYAKCATSGASVKVGVVGFAV